MKLLKQLIKMHGAVPQIYVGRGGERAVGPLFSVCITAVSVVMCGHE